MEIITNKEDMEHVPIIYLEAEKLFKFISEFNDTRININNEPLIAFIEKVMKSIIKFYKNGEKVQIFREGSSPSITVVYGGAKYKISVDQGFGVGFILDIWGQHGPCDSYEEAQDDVEKDAIHEDILSDNKSIIIGVDLASFLGDQEERLVYRLSGVFSYLLGLDIEGREREFINVLKSLDNEFCSEKQRENIVIRLDNLGESGVGKEIERIVDLDNPDIQDAQEKFPGVRPTLSEDLSFSDPDNFSILIKRLKLLGRI